MRAAYEKMKREQLEDHLDGLVRAKVLLLCDLHYLVRQCSCAVNILEHIQLYSRLSRSRVSVHGPSDTQR